MVNRTPDIEHLQAFLATSPRVTILTGAGISLAVVETQA